MTCWHYRPSGCPCKPWYLWGTDLSWFCISRFLPLDRIRQCVIHKLNARIHFSAIRIAVGVTLSNYWLEYRKHRVEDVENEETVTKKNSVYLITL